MTPAGHITIVEPPFLEPSLARPDAWHVAAMASQCGVSARVLDLNVALYRGLLTEEQETLRRLDRDDLIESCASAFFVDPQALRECLASQAPVPPGFPPSVRLPLAEFDVPRFVKLAREALARFDGAGGRMPSHAEYVRDQETINALLEARVRAHDPSAHLSLSRFSSALNPWDAEQVLAAIGSGGSVLDRLYDAALRRSAELGELGRVLVVISQEAQLLPGIALASWLRRTLGAQVTLTGDHLDIVLQQRFFPELLELMDDVLAYRFEYGGRAWLIGDPDPFLLSQGAKRWPEFDCREKTLEPERCIVADGEARRCLGPLPVAAMRVTGRCYWSRCGFCLAATAARYAPRRASVDQVVARLDALPGRGCTHVQFLDYALPPVLVRGLAGRTRCDVRWAAQLRFEKSYSDPDLFRRLHQAGCTQLSWGFETASPRLLASANKGGELRPHEKGRILRMSAEAGIANHVFVMTGLPGETDDDFQQTMRFFEQYVDCIDGAEVYAFQLRPGTGYHRNVRAFGLAPEPPQWGWQSRVPYAGTPTMEESEERVRILTEALRPLAAASGCNDFLEGHLVLREEMRTQ
jgi:hypothetical protein